MHGREYLYTLIYNLLPIRDISLYMYLEQKVMVYLHVYELTQVFLPQQRT